MSVARAVRAASVSDSSRRLYARIGDFLFDQRLEPDPANFAFAYHLLADPHGPLARAVHAMTDGGIRLTQRDIETLNVDAKTIVVEAQVPKESTIFEGHFPGYPLMPGVLLIESMAQASGFLLLGVLKFERMPILAAVKEAKVRGSVFPGDLMTLEASVAHEGSGYAMTEAKIRVGGKLRANSTLTFTLIPFPNSDMRGYMDAVAKRVGFPQQAVSP